MTDRATVVAAGVLVDEGPAEGFEDVVAAGVVEADEPVLPVSTATADTGRRVSAMSEAKSVRFMYRGYVPGTLLSTQERHFFYFL